MKPRVFMLGWEFPPLLNGGLGIASLGLGEALASYVDLTMVIPQSAPAYATEKLQLIGLNELDLDSLWEETEEREYENLKKVKLAYVDVRLSGYEKIDERMLPEGASKKSLYVRRKRNIHAPKQRRSTFGLSIPYGSDLLDRVKDYSEICLRLAQQHSFDIVHAHDWMTFLAGMELKAQFGCPLVLHVHSLEYDRTSPQNHGWVFQLEKHAMEEADAIIPVSHYTARIIKEHYGIAADKVFPVHNGIEKKIEDVEVQAKKNFPEKLVIFLGRLTHQKGPFQFLKAARQVLSQAKNVRFAIAGDGELLPVLTEQIAKDRLGDRIHLTGFLSRQQTRELMAIADVFVMPSISEPFGLVALEAAQLGVPSIISEFSGVAEVLPGSVKVNPADTGRIAEEILSLLENETKFREKADISHLSWDAAARKVRTIYQFVLDKS